MIRHDRQMRLPEIGAAGQDRLRRGHVLVVGAGGLGCPALQYLAAAGVGRIDICDDDRVDLSNLQRQILYTPSDLGAWKAEVAAARLRAFDSALDVRPHVQRFCETDGSRIGDADVVIDASDNFETRYLISALAARAARPVVFGAVSGFSGQLAVFHPPAHACYRCLFPEPPPVPVADCATDGILGAVAGLVGVAMALQAIYLLLDSPALPPLRNRLQLFDLAAGRIDTLALARRPDCPGCRGEAPAQPVVSCETTAVIAPAEAAALPSACWLDVRTAAEFATGHLDAAINLPLDQLAADPAAAAAGLPCDRPVILHCRTGQRSRRAAQILGGRGLQLFILA